MARTGRWTMPTLPSSSPESARRVLPGPAGRSRATRGRAAHHPALRELQLETRRVEPRLVEGLRHRHPQVPMVELAGGEVDGEVELGESPPEPSLELGARRLQDPFADRDDEARLLRDR